MAMSLAVLETLEKAEFPPVQARALAHVFEAESAARQSELATKSDLTQLRQATQFDLAELRQATQSDLAELQRVSKSDLAELRHEVQEGFMKYTARLEVKIEAAKAESVRLTFLVMMGQGTMLAGIMYFLLQNSR